MIQTRFTFALGFLVSAMAFAQEPPPPPLPPPHPDGWAGTTTGLGEMTLSVSGEAGSGGDFVFMRAGMGMQKLVKGSPYSAQATTEFTQTLADGNRIHHTTASSITRDSEGRTRREESITAIGPMAGSGPARKSIFIHDPVAGTSYILEPESHAAHMTHEGRHATAFGSGTAVGEGGSHTVTIRTDTAGERVHARTHSSDVKTEDLGTQVMEGLSVQGKRTTRTIPAGQIGNDLPLQVVTETWYSQELQTTVMSKTNDPRSGQTVYQLTNVSRAEPDPALFQVPVDFKVTQGGEMGGRGMRVVLKEE